MSPPKTDSDLELFWHAMEGQKGLFPVPHFSLKKEMLRGLLWTQSKGNSLVQTITFFYFAYLKYSLPVIRTLYFTTHKSWRGPKSIRRSEMDGSNLVTFVASRWIQGMTIDFAFRRLYWADSGNRIGSCDLEGRDTWHSNSPSTARWIPPAWDGFTGRKNLLEHQQRIRKIGKQLEKWVGHQDLLHRQRNDSAYCGGPNDKST